MIRKLLHHPVAHLATILVLGALAYSNSIGTPFVLDDLTSIVKNPLVQ
ncbi:MAG: hypothetical protein IH608_11755, partial [Proteobacteria bacterium]|nr:hypothetical protein [Pseudomonadota bacterium]